MLRYPAGVGQYLLVGLPRKCPVLVGIHVLDIHQHIVHVRDQALHHGSIGKRRRFNGSRQAVPMARNQECLGEIRLCHTFAAGQRDTAAGALVVHAILFQVAHQFPNRHIAPDRFGRAVHVHGLDAVLLRLRVAAPATAQMTSLEENDGADTGTVMQGVALYIKNPTGLVVYVFHHDPIPS